MKLRYAIPLCLALTLAVSWFAKSNGGFKAGLVGAGLYVIWFICKGAARGFSFLYELLEKRPALISRLKRVIPVCLALVLFASLVTGKPTGVKITLAGFVFYLCWIGILNAEKARQEMYARQARREMPLFSLDAGKLTMDNGGKTPKEKPFESLGRVLILTRQGPWGMDVFLLLLFRDGMEWEIAAENPCYEEFYQSLDRALSLNPEQAALSASATGDAMFPLWEGPSFSSGFSLSIWIEQKKREDLWYVMSDLFVDNEICWRWITRNCAGYDIPLLRRIFFEEVAPYCGPNICAMIPPIWSGFSRRELLTGIRNMLAEREASLRGRCMHGMAVLFYRWKCQSLWAAFAARLKRAAAAQTPEEREAILADRFFDAE